MTYKFILFGTSACHLCTQAEALLDALTISYQMIDIAEQEQYQAVYAVKIPVLLKTANHAELCWPFDADRLEHFIYD